MRCNGCRGQLVDYLYDELSPARRARVESHLEICAACRRALGEMRFALTLARQAPRPAPEKIPTQNLLAAARRQAPVRGYSWRDLWRRPAFAGALGLLFAGGVMLYQFQDRHAAHRVLDASAAPPPAIEPARQDERRVQDTFAPPGAAQAEWDGLAEQAAAPEDARPQAAREPAATPMTGFFMRSDGVRIEAPLPMDRDRLLLSEPPPAEAPAPPAPLLLAPIAPTVAERFERGALPDPDRKEEERPMLGLGRQIDGEARERARAPESVVAGVEVVGGTSGFAYDARELADNLELFFAEVQAPSRPDLAWAERRWWETDAAGRPVAPSAVPEALSLADSRERAQPEAPAVQAVLAQPEALRRESPRAAPARPALRRAAGLASASAEIEHALAQTLARAGRPEAAEAIYRRLIVQATDYAELGRIHVELGDLLAEQHKWKEALESYRLATTLPSGSAIKTLGEKLRRSEARLTSPPAAAQD